MKILKHGDSEIIQSLRVMMESIIMKELTCTCCKCTATVENEDTLPPDWCEVNIPNKTCEDFVGILCNDCKLRLLQSLIDHGAYLTAYKCGNSLITDSSKPITWRCRFKNKTL